MSTDTERDRLVRRIGDAAKRGDTVDFGALDWTTRAEIRHRLRRTDPEPTYCAVCGHPEAYHDDEGKCSATWPGREPEECSCPVSPFAGPEPRCKCGHIKRVHTVLAGCTYCGCGAVRPTDPEPDGEREAETSDWLRDNLPSEWDYRIYVRGVGGVTVRAWDYEAPKTEEYVLESTQVDPRETRDDRDMLAQVRLGLERIASRASDADPQPTDRGGAGLCRCGHARTDHVPTDSNRYGRGACSVCEGDYNCVGYAPDRSGERHGKAEDPFCPACESGMPCEMHLRKYMDSEVRERAARAPDDGGKSTREAIGRRVQEYSRALYDLKRRLLGLGLTDDARVLLYVLCGERALGAMGETRDDLPDPDDGPYCTRCGYPEERHPIRRYPEKKCEYFRAPDPDDGDEGGERAKPGPLDPRFRHPLSEQNIRDAVGLIGSDSMAASSERKEEAARALAREILRLRRSTPEEGVLRDVGRAVEDAEIIVCSGCGKEDCGSCPAGTSRRVDADKLHSNVMELVERWGWTMQPLRDAMDPEEEE